MDKCNAIILSNGQKGLYNTIDPGIPAGQNLLWQQDIEKFGPWHKNDTHPWVEEKGDFIWKTEFYPEKQIVVICGQCTSSMDVAWHFIERNKLKVWDSILGVEQTKGRGQHQRDWISPAGNIYAAWRWPYPTASKGLDSRWQGFMSLIAGYLLARIIKEEYGLAVEIKWPNDLLLNRQKFGGILTEMRSGSLLIGVGINILFSPDTALMRDDMAISATNLVDEGADAKPLSLWATIVEKGKTYFEQITGSLTTSEFIKILTPYLAWIGQKVLVKSIDQQPFTAIIKGISDQGGLVLQVGDEEKVVYTGSIIQA